MNNQKFNCDGFDSEGFDEAGFDANGSHRNGTLKKMDDAPNAPLYEGFFVPQIENEEQLTYAEKFAQWIKSKGGL